MESSLTFARHFARLVSLLLYEPANVAEQKGTLRALAIVAREGGVELVAADDGLAANGFTVLAALPGVETLVARMDSHRVAAVESLAGAPAADLLAAARALASPAAAGPTAGGATVRFVSTHEMASLPWSPVSAPESSGPAEDAPAAAGGTLPDQARTAVGGPPPRPAATAAPARLRAGMFEHFAAASGSRASAEEVLARLDEASGMEGVAPLLDTVVASAETASGEGSPRLAAEILYRVVRREREATSPDEKRSFMLAVRRLCRGDALRAVATGLARDPREREKHLVVLARAGEDGADAVIDELVNATERAERRVYFDALVGMKAAVPTLTHMLGDPRWYVARNAAALLGEMGATEAEEALSDLVYHDDERVRHAATVSMMRLNTSRALAVIEGALRDRAPEIRKEAAAALLARRDGLSAEPLIRALDGERDEEVQATFLVALGRIASLPAVTRLARAAEPDRALFRKKPVAVRVAAVHGLAEARTPEALAALRALAEDRSPEVREAARAALGGAVGR